VEKLCSVYIKKKPVPSWKVRFKSCLLIKIKQLELLLQEQQYQQQEQQCQQR
jgi:hypothetical protein